MGKSFYILLWGGLFFLSIGLWMMKRDRDEMRMREARMIEKENSLYELYESLKIMNEMIYHYRIGIVQSPPPLQLKMIDMIPYWKQ